MDELTKRNFHTMSEGMKSLREKYDEQKLEMRKLRESNAIVVGELAAVKEQLAHLFARIAGHGPTQPR